LRVPFIIYDPRLPEAKRGTVSSQMVLNIDAPATMLELAGVEVPAHYQGESLQPLIQGQALPEWRTEFFCEHLMEYKSIPKWEGVRGERYVYAKYFGQEPAYEFLHDLKADPNQLINLASNPEYQKILNRMQLRTEAYKSTYTPPALANQ
jgi:arylsulfatase A-like enzyme